jgi:uncharacterized RDD family membrane protein YckC
MSDDQSYGQPPPPPPPPPQPGGSAPPPGFPGGYGPQQPYGAPPGGSGQVPYAGYYGTAAYASGGYAPPGHGFELAHWGLRVGAVVIDNFVLAGVVLGMGIVSIPFTAGTGEGDGASAGASVAAVGLMVLAGLGVWIWNRGVKQGTTGRSIGKKALGIRLISEVTGQPAGTGTALARDLAHIVDRLPLNLGFLWPLWDEKKQTFSDKIVGTLVIRG